MPINIRDLSNIFFKEISKSDLDLLDTFSQKKTSNLNEKFHLVRHENSNIYLEINKNAIVLEFD